MSEKSKIQWTDDTYNPWRGCTKVSAGCTNCYAEKLITTRLRHVHYAAATADGGKRTSKQFHATGGAAGSGIQFWGKGSPRIRAVNLEEPLRWNEKPFICEGCGKAFATNLITHVSGPEAEFCCNAEYHRRRVFSLSLGDWLDDEVPIEWLADFLDVVRRCENLDWLLVTKRPELFWGRETATEYVPGRLQTLQESLQDGPLKRWLCLWGNGHPPANVIVLVSVEDQEAADKRIPLLLKIPAARRGLSCEPLLGPVDLHGANYANPYGGQTGAVTTWRGGVDWVIVGGESGPDARPCNVEWIRRIKDDCRAIVPCFVKQLGANPEGVKVIATKGDVMDQWPADLQVRQFYK